MLRIASIALVLCAAAPASAQDDGELPAAFTSDRPGFADSTQIAAHARLTTELGVQAQFGDVETGTLPLLELRTGLFDWLELRFLAPNAVAHFDDDVTAGINDPVVGFKIGGPLYETVSMSSVWQVSIPIGTDGFGNGEATWFANVQLEWEFWGPLSVIPNGFASVVLAVDDVTGETRRVFQGGGSLALWWQIIDVFGIYAQSVAVANELTRVQVSVGGGIYWQALPNVQIDASFNGSVTRQGIPPTVSAGGTILW